MSVLVPMTIKGLMLDPISNAPIVVLKDGDEKIFLPIWVGIFEANAIALQLEHVETPRPMTHDLLRNVFQHVDATVKRVVISELKESTFYALIQVFQQGRIIEIDARPSDALAIALRTDAPIFVEQAVLDQAQTISPEETKEDRLKKWLEETDLDDLGKYKM
ncbi:MAG TPA: bifunctional nuclease family protein [Thermoanaerobaculia bacterium]|nr:bifunctional nuclease family protein [Thermoanaerobaculia bacterium]